MHWLTKDRDMPLRSLSDSIQTLCCRIACNRWPLLSLFLIVLTQSQWITEKYPPAKLSFSMVHACEPHIIADTFYNWSSNIYQKATFGVELSQSMQLLSHDPRSHPFVPPQQLQHGQDTVHVVALRLKVRGESSCSCQVIQPLLKKKARDGKRRVKNNDSTRW